MGLISGFFNEYSRQQPTFPCKLPQRELPWSVALAQGPAPPWRCGDARDQVDQQISKSVDTKKAAVISHSGFHLILPAATYSPMQFPTQYIGGSRLNFRVRNGNGCGPAPMTTGNLLRVRLGC